MVGVESLAEICTALRTLPACNPGQDGTLESIENTFHLLTQYSVS